MSNLTYEDIIRGIVTVIFVGIYAYLTVTGKEASQSFQTILITTLGFYFGLNELGKIAGKYLQSRKDTTNAAKSTGNRTN